MTKQNLYDKPGASASDRKVLDAIHEYGFYMLSVAPREGDPEEWFAYTIGLFANLGHPEVIVFGVDGSDAFHFLSRMAEEIKAGRKYSADGLYPGIFPDRPAAFRPVDPTHREEYLCWASWFYEHADFPVLQCFWPDGDGHFPWEPAADPETRELQPILDRPRG